MTLAFPERMPPAVSLGRGRWQTDAPWSFTINGMQTTVPTGFICDLYSVPWPISAFIPRDEHDNRPAMIHDWLYATVGLRVAGSGLSRAECDVALRLACHMCEFPARRAWSIFTGVRIGGWLPWRDLDNAGHSLAYPKLG